MKTAPSVPKKVLVDEGMIKEELQNKHAWNTYHALTDFSTVTSLDLSNQNFLAIPCLMRVFNLKFLNLSRNQIAVLCPNRLPHRIETLDLSWNEICELSKDVKGTSSVILVLSDGELLDCQQAKLDLFELES